MLVLAGTACLFEFLNFFFAVVRFLVRFDSAGYIPFSNGVRLLCFNRQAMAGSQSVADGMEVCTCVVKLLSPNSNN